MRGNRRVRIALTVALATVAATAGQESAQPEQIRAAVSTATAKHAYVIGRSGELKIVDMDSGSVLATVDTNAHTTGLAVSPDGRTAYVVNGWIGTVTVVDTATARIVKRVKINAQLDSAVVRTDGQRLYVTATANDQGLVLAIDTSTNTLAAVIQVGATPTGVATSPDGHRLYVSNNQGASVTVVDTRIATPIATIPVAALPQYVTVSPDGSTTYVTHASRTPTTNSTVTVIDNATNKVVDEVEVGSGASGLAVSADGRELFVSNLQDGTVSVVDTASRSVQDTLVMQARGITTVPKDHRVYFATDSSATVLDSNTSLVSSQVDLVGMIGRQFSATTIVITGA
jgi:YVTN family beta-propeller protein